MPSIPKEVCFIYNDEESVFPSFSEDGENIEVKAKDLTIVDVAKKKKIEEKYQDATRGTYDYKTRTYATLTAYKEKINNEPKSGYEVLNLQSKYNSPTRYNILTPDGLVFLMHEDILIQVMTGPGIGAGGKLNGEYVWGNTKKGVSLIPVDSPIYKEILNSERNKAGKIKGSNLKVGCVYENGHCSTRIFLGKINTKRAKTVWHNDSCKLREIRGGYLWLDYWKGRKARWGDVGLSDLLKEVSLWRLKITMAPSVYKKIHTFKKVPSIEDAREQLIKKEHVPADAAGMEERKKRQFAELLNMSSSKSPDYTYPGYKQFFKELIVSNIVDS